MPVTANDEQYLKRCARRVDVKLHEPLPTISVRNWTHRLRTHTALLYVSL